MNTRRKLTAERLQVFIYHRKYNHIGFVMGIPEAAIDELGQNGLMWKITYRQLKQLRRDHPERQYKIRGIDWITDKPKEGGEK